MKKEYKYVLTCNTIIIDDKGKIKSESWGQTFNSGTLPEMRNEAFTKHNDLVEFFDEFNDDEKFDSPLAAGIKGWKNTKGYSISICFYIDDLDYQIVGDEDFQDEALEVEENEFNSIGYFFEIM